jgi:hypothetical protein
VFSYPLHKELRDRNSVCSGLCAAASDHNIEVVTRQGEVSEVSDLKVTGRMVSGNYFNLLGLEPAAGRLFSDSDDTTENANPEVVLGYGYWQRKFALSPTIIGKGHSAEWVSIHGCRRGTRRFRWGRGRRADGTLCSSEHAAAHCPGTALAQLRK